MLLLKIIFEDKTEFINITKNFKLIVSFALVFVFVTGHLLPYISNLYLEKSIKKNSFLQKDKYLKKANYYMPINSTPLINRALLYFNAFTKTFNFDFFFSALDMIKRAKRLSPDNPEIYNIELQFYIYYYKPIIKLRTKSEKSRQAIDNILVELLTLINKIEKIDPNNPFLRFNKAKLLLEFDKKKQALVELQKTIEIDPDYLDALIMLNNEFDYFKNKTKYKKKIAKIKEKTRQLKLKQGSYLYKLFNNS
jgi:tetratricopeptide (TPR) repeat protein